MSCTLERCLCHHTNLPITEAVYGEKPRNKKKAGPERTPRPERQVVDALDGGTLSELSQMLTPRQKRRWGW